jgi:hypothetical protein
MLAIMGSIVLAMFSYPALSQTSPIAPNGITFINNTDTFSANQPDTVYVQLLYNGQNLKSEGVRVYFLAKNIDLIPAGLGTYTLTDANGMANFTFTANVTGDTNLTATAMGPNSGVTATQTLHIISGAVPTSIPSITPTPSAAATGAPTPTSTPSLTPTANPTYVATPSATPATGDVNAQARGIIGVGIAVAIIIIAAIFIARRMGKK